MLIKITLGHSPRRREIGGASIGVCAELAVCPHPGTKAAKPGRKYPREFPRAAHLTTCGKIRVTAGAKPHYGPNFWQLHARKV